MEARSTGRNTHSTEYASHDTAVCERDLSALSGSTVTEIPQSMSAVHILFSYTTNSTCTKGTKTH